MRIGKIKVRDSKKDWLGHLIDVFTQTKENYGLDNALKFLDYYLVVYKTHGRSYIDYRLGIALFDEYKSAKRIGTRLYACIGIGGAGKTTIMKNVLYFLDPTLNNSMITTEMKQSMNLLLQVPKDSYKSILMDEPDDEIHQSSKEGKQIRRVAGKWRQHGVFIAICATDVSDIPPYLWKKVHGLFFCPDYGQVWFFQNRPKELKFPIQRIKRDIMQYGYDLLVALRKHARIFKSYGETPLDNEKTEYEETKWDDYIEDINKTINILGQAPKKNNVCNSCKSKKGYMTEKGWICKACGYLSTI